jgi:hypothetical protein
MKVEHVTDTATWKSEEASGPVPEVDLIPPGVHETRRLILQAPLAAVAGLVLHKIGAAKQQKMDMAPVGPGSVTPGAIGAGEAGQIDFDELFQQCAALAGSAYSTARLNEDAHLYSLAAAAAHLNLKSVPEAKTGRFGGLNPPVSFGPVRVRPPLAIILWRLDPGAVLPAHNHTPADVLSICLAGEARVRHFDILGRAPEYSSRAAFLVRETRNMLLTPGRMSGLTQTRDNIHTFHAGEQGATGIDINSVLPGNKDFSFLEISEQTTDSQKGIYEAVWTKI